jgi:hypothetical protein
MQGQTKTLGILRIIYGGLGIFFGLLVLLNDDTAALFNKDSYISYHP